MRFREVSPVPTASDGDSLAGGAAVAAGFSDNAELTQLLVVERSEELLTGVHRLRSGDRLVVRGFWENSGMPLRIGDAAPDFELRQARFAQHSQSARSRR